ncbi:MAG: flavodoxin domain-containing protein [Anaerolineae bacterium]|jgi:menaquinone-dependent protoporphyrinogen oxidase
MSDKVLVAYGSKYGSTAEIADAIGQVLREAGFDADVRSAETVQDLASYQAVVLGSGVYAGMWRKEAAEFLEAHQAELAERPVWLFSSGPSGKGDPVELLDGWRFPDAQKPIADRISPRDMAVFHGNIDRDKLNLAEKLIVKAVKGEFGDFRDWEAIHSWASGVASALSS